MVLRATNVTSNPMSAGTIAPLTGWYEGWLPESHPMQMFFAKSDTRLVFREKGELFPNLGVTPQGDEAFVQWAWMRAT